MPKLCSCIRLNLLSPGISSAGEVACEWNVADSKHAQLDFVTKNGCGGGGGIGSATAGFAVNGCGRLRITLSGPGSAYNETPSITVSVRGVPVASWRGSGGWDVDCTTGSMVQTEGTDPTDVTVCCGDHVNVECYHASYNTPELNLSLSFEVL